MELKEISTRPIRILFRAIYFRVTRSRIWIRFTSKTEFAHLGASGRIVKVLLTSSCGVRNTNFQSVFNFSTILRATERSECFATRWDEGGRRKRKGCGGHEGDDDSRVHERSCGDSTPYKTYTDASVVFFSPSRSYRLSQTWAGLSNHLMQWGLTQVAVPVPTCYSPPPHPSNRSRCHNNFGRKDSSRLNRLAESADFTFFPTIWS